MSRCGLRRSWPEFVSAERTLRFFDSTLGDVFVRELEPGPFVVAECGYGYAEAETLDEALLLLDKHKVLVEEDQRSYLKHQALLEARERRRLKRLERVARRAAAAKAEEDRLQ